MTGRQRLLRAGRAVEAAVLRGLWRVFAALPVDTASAIGGALGRAVGPRLPLSNRARASLRRVFPWWTPAERERVVRGMWDNLGRAAGEFPHVPALVAGDGTRVTVSGTEHLAALRDDGAPGILFTAHIGNWEVGACAAAHHGLPLHVVYRAANNPRTDALINANRHGYARTLIPKGRSGARAMADALRRGGHLGVLVDQKMNDGIAVPFLGRAAMTGPAVAAFARHHGCPLVPLRVIRTHGAHFHVAVEPPVPVAHTEDRERDLHTTMARVNAVIGRWITEHPEQWLWLHRRWGKE